MGNAHSTAHPHPAQGRPRGGSSAATTAAPEAAGSGTAAGESLTVPAEPSGSPAGGGEAPGRPRASGASERQRRGLSSLTAGLLSSSRDHRGASGGRGWRTHGGNSTLGAANGNGGDAQGRAPAATRQPFASTGGRGGAGRRGEAGVGGRTGGAARSNTAAAAAAAAAAVAAATAVGGEAEGGAAGNSDSDAGDTGAGAVGAARGGGGGGEGVGGDGAGGASAGGGEGEGEQAGIQEQRTQTVRSLVNLRKHSVALVPVPRALLTHAGGGGHAGGIHVAAAAGAAETGGGGCEREQQSEATGGKQQQEEEGGHGLESNGERASSSIRIPPLSYPAGASLPACDPTLPSASTSGAGVAGSTVPACVAAAPSAAAAPGGEASVGSGGGGEQGVVHPYVYGVSFIADCAVPCNVTVHVMAYEKDRHRKDKPPRLKSKVTQREASASGVLAGLEQRFSLPSACLLAFDGFQEGQLTSTRTSASHTYPVVIRLQTALPAGRAHDAAVRAQQQTHTTYATLVKQAESTWGIQVLKQVLWVGGCSYVLHEIYGIDGPASDPAALPSAPGGQPDASWAGANVECVVCLEDPRDTLVLPCRHLCLCLECAKALRFQSNKCPICRSVVQSLLQIKLSASRDPSQSEAVPATATAAAPAQAVGGGSMVAPSASCAIEVGAATGATALSAAAMDGEQEEGRSERVGQGMEEGMQGAERELRDGEIEQRQGGVEGRVGGREVGSSSSSEEERGCTGGDGVAVADGADESVGGGEGKESGDVGGEEGAGSKTVYGRKQAVSWSGSGQGLEEDVGGCGEGKREGKGAVEREKEGEVVEEERGGGSWSNVGTEQQGDKASMQGAE